MFPTGFENLQVKTDGCATSGCKLGAKEFEITCGQSSCKVDSVSYTINQILPIDRDCTEFPVCKGLLIYPFKLKFFKLKFLIAKYYFYQQNTSLRI